MCQRSTVAGTSETTVRSGGFAHDLRDGPLFEIGQVCPESGSAHRRCREIRQFPVKNRAMCTWCAY
jgi:hypothetical protein